MRRGVDKKVWVLLVALGLLGALGFWVSHPPGAPQDAPPDLSAAPVDTARVEAQWPQVLAHAAAPPRGRADARYTLAEFGDFQCPQCGKAYPLLDRLLKRYPDQVNLVFLHRPFAYHQWAVPAGQASEIAAAQGKFWPMYDALYTHQDDLEPGFYGDYAARAGLDRARFQAALQAGQGLDAVQADARFADSLGIQMTPTLLLRDNAGKTVTVYVGTLGTKNKDGSPQYPGVKDLLSRPPWLTRSAQAPPPSPPPSAR